VPPSLAGPTPGGFGHPRRYPARPLFPHSWVIPLRPGVVGRTSLLDIRPYFRKHRGKIDAIPLVGDYLIGYVGKPIEQEQEIIVPLDIATYLNQTSGDWHRDALVATSRVVRSLKLSARSFCAQNDDSGDSPCGASPHAG
jgi:hypothetical protein